MRNIYIYSDYSGKDEKLAIVNSCYEWVYIKMSNLEEKNVLKMYTLKHELQLIIVTVILRFKIISWFVVN